MSKDEQKAIEAEVQQLELTISLLQERSYELRRKLDGVSTPTNARKGLSEKDKADLILSLRKNAYGI
jgi:hypothetical protein